MAVAGVEDLKAKIRDVPDWPQEGIVFKDIMPLLADPEALTQTIDLLADWAEERRPQVVIGGEARGFFIGSAIAYKLGCGFVPARRPGEAAAGDDQRRVRPRVRAQHARAPGRCVRGRDAGADPRRRPRDRGDLKAMADLVEQLGGEVVGMAFLIELDFLKGREKLTDYDVFSLIHY